jgi:hypothetical protein
MRRKIYLLCLLFLVPTFLAACGPRENCAQSHDPRNTRTLRICIDKEKYDFPEPIHITFTVTNISDETIEFNGGDKPALDIRVEGEHWSDGRELTPELTRVTLEPGESRVLNWVWPTSQTDLEELGRGFSPGPGMLSIGVDGIVIPQPNASRRAVLVYAYYRYP